MPRFRDGGGIREEKGRRHGQRQQYVIVVPVEVLVPAEVGNEPQYALDEGRDCRNRPERPPGSPSDVDPSEVRGGPKGEEQPGQAERDTLLCDLLLLLPPGCTRLDLLRVVRPVGQGVL